MCSGSCAKLVAIVDVFNLRLQGTERVVEQRVPVQLALWWQHKYQLHTDSQGGVGGAALVLSTCQAQLCQAQPQYVRPRC